MAERWVKIDYTGKTIEDSGNEIVEQASAASAEELAQLALRFKHRERPSYFVSALREMSRNGNEFPAKLDSVEERADSSYELDTASTTVSFGACHNK